MNQAKALRTDRQDNVVVNYLAQFDNPNTKRKYLGAMREVIAVASEQSTGDVSNESVFSFAWHKIEPVQLKQLKARLKEAYAPRTASVCFVVTRGILGVCFDMELIDADRWMRIQRVKGVSVQTNQKAGRRLSEGEIMALARVCAEDPGPAGARDDSIIGIGYTQGPRVSEFANFQLEDYDPATGDLIIRKGKGGKTRTIRASNSTKHSLEEWIELRGDEPGPLFTPINKGQNIQIRPISTISLQKMIRERAAQAGVAAFGMHDLRRSFLTNGWSAGIPGTQLQVIAGHSSIETTASYDRGDLETALRSTERLHYPSMRQELQAA